MNQSRWIGLLTAVAFGFFLTGPVVGSEEDEENSGEVCVAKCYEEEDSCLIECNDGVEGETCSEKCNAAADVCMEECE